MSRFKASMRILAALAIAAALAAAASAGSASGPVRAEIEVLLARLEHRGTLRSTGQFIDLAATSSSCAVIGLPVRQAASAPR